MGDFIVVGKSLTEVVESETSGDFRTLLLRLLQVCFTICTVYVQFKFPNETVVRKRK